MVTLSAFSKTYFHARKVSRMYADTVTRRAAAIERYARETAIERVLCEPIVNAFLDSLVLSPFTVRSYRSDLLALWNSAADLELLPYPVARRIHCQRLPPLLVECLTLDETRRILEAAKLYKGVYRNGVSRAAYWSAAIRLGWDTGFRRGDVWLFRRDSVRPDGTLRIVQHKTMREAMVRLRASTIEALDAIPGNYPCRWTLDPSYFGRHFKKLVKLSGVNRSTFRWLRRSSGSYVEAEQPGAGHKHLGNGAVVFQRHYDAKLAGPALPSPPEL